MSTFDETGLVIDRYDDILTKSIDDLKSVWGEGIKSDPQSVIGQFLAIFSEALADQNELVEAVANAFNPQAATGVFLSQIVLFNGLTRKEALYSTVTLELTANAAGSTVPAGSLVSDPLVGDQYATDSVTVIAPSGTETVSATAVEEGPKEAPVGTLTQIDTPIFGWESVTNPSSAVPGRDEETDTELRIRRDVASKKTGIGTVLSIKSALNDIDGVDMVAVEANNTAATVDGVPPQHIRAVVNGGTDPDIAEALWNNVAAGIGYYGNTTEVYTDSESGDSFTIKFDRPTERLVWIIVNLTKNASYPASGNADMKAALVDWFEENLSLGDDVFHSRLYTPINTIPGHTVDSLYIGFSDPPTQENDLTIAINEVARTELAKITING